MKRYLSSLSLVLAGAILGGVAVANMPGARAQDQAEEEDDEGLPADLRGDVVVVTASGRDTGKIVDFFELGSETFVKLDLDGPLPDRYLNLAHVLTIMPVK